MIVIVTGGRDYAGTGLVTELARIHAEVGIEWLVLGDCPTGADAIAAKWASPIDGPQTWTCHADWAGLGKGAGPKRNQMMVNAALELRDESAPAELPVLCLAAPGGRGTADCVGKAVAAGIEVRRIA